MSCSTSSSLARCPPMSFLSPGSGPCVSPSGQPCPHSVPCPALGPLLCHRRHKEVWEVTAPHSCPLEGSSQLQMLRLSVSYEASTATLSPILRPPRGALWAPVMLDDPSVTPTPHSALTLSVDRRPPSSRSRLQPQKPRWLEAVLRWALLLSGGIPIQPFSSKLMWHFIIVSPMKYTFCLASVGLVLYPKVDCKLLEDYVSLLSVCTLPNQQCLQRSKHWGSICWIDFI